MSPKRRSRAGFRNEESEGVGIETMPVPNSLRHKATGDVRAAVSPESIRQAAVQLLLDRATNLIRNRKFIVTTSYVGPKRRRLQLRRRR